MSDRKAPLFEIDNTVIMPPNLYKETEGKITECLPAFKEIDSRGKFKSGGLVTTEDTIKGICLPYTFDGETLVVQHPEQQFVGFTRPAFEHVSKFYGYIYVVDTYKLRTMVSEKKLKLKNK